MYEFTLPDYKGTSIVNLMSSISHSFGKKHSYNELTELNSNYINKFKNVALIVIDGMGYNYLYKQKSSFLFKKIKSKMTSTFLSTTACANTVFSVGYPPQQHALTGWDIHLKEVGAVVSVLPLSYRYNRKSITETGREINKILDIESFYKGFQGDCFALFNKSISHSHFTNYTLRDSKVISTKNYKKSFTKLKRLIRKKSPNRRFIQMYLSELDSNAHEEGINSKSVQNVFNEFDNYIEKISNSIEGTNTLLMVVADHGFTNTEKKKEIFIEDISGLKECLTTALAGEGRVRDVFVRPSKVNDFEKIVKKNLSKICWCFKGEKLIKEGFYGLGKPNKKLLDRVGDYVLIMKENYVLRDRLANYNRSKEFHKGVHGGVTEDEMFVPLILIEA